MKSERNSATCIRVISDTPNLNNRYCRGKVILLRCYYCLESESVVKNQNDVSFLRNEEFKKSQIYEFAVDHHA